MDRGYYETSELGISLNAEDLLGERKGPYYPREPKGGERVKRSPEQIRYLTSRSDRASLNLRTRIKLILTALTAAAVLAGPADYAKDYFITRPTSVRIISQVAQPDQGLTQVIESTSTPIPLTPQESPTPQEYREFNRDLLNKILASSFGSDERYKLENQYVLTVQTLKQVDMGLITISDPELRKDLISLRYKLREKGTPGLRQLTKEELNWSKENKIHPEVLGIATDQYFEAKKMLEEYMKRVGRDQFLKQFRPDLLNEVKEGRLTKTQLDAITVDDMLINPGGAAALIDFETAGLINTGAQPAYDQLSPREQGIFTEIIGDISEETGLNIDPKNVPGSEAGASGLQFMPETTSRLRQTFRKLFSFNFNHLDPRSAIKGIYLMLAQGEEVIDSKGNPGFRHGYAKGAIFEKFRKFAILKWNQLQEELDAILKGAISYYNQIIALNPNKFNVDFTQQYWNAVKGIFNPSKTTGNP